MAYLMLLDGETLRRLGKGVGLELAAACKSWVARKALCAPPQLLARDGHSKLVGEIVVQPDPHLYSNSEGVLLMTVVLTKDIRDTKLWQPAGDLISYRLGSPPVQCGLCRATVAQRELNSHQRECPQLSTACPRCSKRVPVRELATHQTGEECLRSSCMCTQTDEKEYLRSGGPVPHGGFGAQSGAGELQLRTAGARPPEPGASEAAAGAQLRPALGAAPAPGAGGGAGVPAERQRAAVGGLGAAAGGAAGHGALGE
ncbi:unnamed protein product, partial [Effrenium voratum]